jgi:hypothetical protein
MAAGVGQVGRVDVELLAAAAAALRAEQEDVAGPAGEGIAQVVEGAAGDPVAVGAMTAPRSGAPAVIAAADADLGLGQVLGPIDADGRVGAIFAGSWHRVTPERKVLPGDTRFGGKAFTSAPRFPCHGLKIRGENRRDREEEWYFDPDGGRLRRKDAIDGWQRSLMPKLTISIMLIYNI